MGPYALALLIDYPLLTRSLRYRRLRQLHKQYPYTTRESMTRRTDEEAYQIQKSVLQLEFPFVFVKALQFALFRVCKQQKRTKQIFSLFAPTS